MSERNYLPSRLRRDHAAALAKIAAGQERACLDALTEIAGETIRSGVRVSIQSLVDCAVEAYIDRYRRAKCSGQ